MRVVLDDIWQGAERCRWQRHLRDCKSGTIKWKMTMVLGDIWQGAEGEGTTGTVNPEPSCERWHFRWHLARCIRWRHHRDCKSGTVMWKMTAVLGDIMHRFVCKELKRKAPQTWCVGEVKLRQQTAHELQQEGQLWVWVTWWHHCGFGWHDDIIVGFGDTMTSPCLQVVEREGTSCQWQYAIKWL